MQKSKGLRQFSKSVRSNIPSITSIGPRETLGKVSAKLLTPLLRILEDLIFWIKHCSKS